MDDELATLRAAIESHRKERDRYEKASEVAMQALRDERHHLLHQIERLDRTIAAILLKLAAGLDAKEPGLEMAKDAIRAVLEEFSPETNLDNLLCPGYRPDHNGECLNCDEPASEHPET